MKHNSRKWSLKPVSLLLAAVLMCGMVGCSKNETSTPESSLGDSQNISADNSIEDFEPVPVPEGGWKVESLSKTIRINGKPLPEPFTVNNLGEKYSFEPSSISNSGTLKFEKKDIAVISFDDESENPDDRKKNIRSFALFTELCEDNNFITFNGIHLGSTMTEVESALGKPTVEFDVTNVYLWDYSEAGYDDENYFFVIWIDKSSETVSSIGFYLKK